MAHKTFTTKPLPEREPTTFMLDGVGGDGEPWKEQFTCLAVAPSGVLDDLTSSSLLDPQGNRVYNATSLIAFFEGVLIEDDVVRFRRLVHDKNRIVDLDTLGDLMQWLSEELLGRPTKR